ncbi:CDF family Co(II)/Ni(II) efflux transporter DmeF [Phenylobacterium sp.]|jgi:cation diffusion facilitator family transporter|uniref:CDF family Co(II)/Ni(II) efflux transporter DmeF n=1 Tax=Phenylobacterium sp. TaxID=1871053 RepID=UPI002E33D73F|nr:CDF family Co(II)/Ni(II) efflux transporter DmeF [Phenylobacterium sp.]HEX4709795.1 CDF family Co(II)/Ni(II) efflux transporter DmeF [Phenylobacterium sp.]
MTYASPNRQSDGHSHQFLGAGHERNERRTWFVIVLCGAMMLIEIVGGLTFGSIALVADGLHMSTHAGALLLAALAYTFSRRYADDPRFSFGTGKLGDLAGFTSAIVLAMIALLIGYEALIRFLSPVPIHFSQAIPIAVLGLGVNVASVWLLGGEHDHHHGHGHGGHAHGEESQRLPFQGGAVELSIFETDTPPRFRVAAEGSARLSPETVAIETVRPDGARQAFPMADFGAYLESVDEIPEPHAFAAHLKIGDEDHVAVFEEHDHGHAHHRDNNMRAAVVHVLADAAVSVLVIVGLLLARLFGWLWMDPLAGLVGACVIASWSYGLIRDTGAILLDMNPDRRLADVIRSTVETQGDKVCDLHLWRLGPGHLGAIVGVKTDSGRSADFYRSRLERLPSISHLTVEVTAPRT